MVASQIINHIDRMEKQTSEAFDKFKSFSEKFVTLLAAEQPLRELQNEVMKNDIDIIDNNTYDIVKINPNDIIDIEPEDISTNTIDDNIVDRIYDIVKDVYGNQEVRKENIPDIVKKLYEDAGRYDNIKKFSTDYINYYNQSNTDVSSIDDVCINTHIKNLTTESVRLKNLEKDYNTLISLYNDINAKYNTIMRKIEETGVIL